MADVLVTGANGEVGHAIIPKLAEQGKTITALDINDLDKSLIPSVKTFVKGSVLDKKTLNALLNKLKIDTVYHLAAILSTSAENNPEKAHIVNVGGTSTLLEALNNYASKNKTALKFIFPSTVAVYGIPNLETKEKTPPVKEEQFPTPITMYGINKLYCENLGIYYSRYYKSLELKPEELLIDFRAVRFPGLISAITLPSGGTSDYAPEMIHTAAQGKAYESFVRIDTTLPFMAMPDAVKAIISLSNAPKEKLTKPVYNVTSFSITAGEIAEIVLRVFPDTAISYNPDEGRQKIVDSWPASMDDSAAKKDWGWQPEYDMTKTFSEYLIPEIKKEYDENTQKAN
jgi:threonine 3-dehydrogenase